ncbi:MAG: DNA-3-methyladenine glycosylase [Bacteroidota bacterium]
MTRSESTWYNTSSKPLSKNQRHSERVIRLLDFQGKTILIEVSGDDHELQVRQLNSGASLVEEGFIRSYVDNWFDLSRDLTSFYELADQDKVLQSVARDYQGLRLVSIVDMFEALCWSVIGQQINLTFAYKLKRALTEQFGKSVKHDDREYFLFPRPADLVDTDPSELLSLQFSRQKANYIINLAKAFENGDLIKEELSSLELEHAVEKLVQVKGIGPWTANYVAMKCLKHPDAFPLQDVGLHNALKLLLKRDAKPSLEEIKAFSKNWEGWKAYATIYLWRSLTVKPLSVSSR